MEKNHNKTTTRKCSRALVFKWHKRLKDGRDGVYHDDKRCGRPATVGESLPAKVKELIKADRRLTVSILEERFGVSFSTIHKILTENLNMSRCSARWVPRLLKDDEKITELRDDVSKINILTFASPGSA